MNISHAAESKKLVRIYSKEVGARLPRGSRTHDLGQLLQQEAQIHDDPQSPWRKFFEGSELVTKENNPLTKKVAVEATKLRQKWLSFRQNCAGEDQLDIDTYEPSIESVFDVVEDVQKKWDANRHQGAGGKFVKYFHKFCGTLDSHSTMLKILPEGNEYISILTGTLTTVIQASANHEKIAEGLSQSLQSIGQSVAACNRDLDMFNTKAILEHVSELYGLIFIFLSAYMDWFMKKRRYRFLDSFNESLTQKFEKNISDINQKADQIRRMVEQSSRAEVRETRVGMDNLQTGFAEMKRDIRVGLEGDERHRAELAYDRALLIEEIRYMRQKQEQSDQSINKLTQTLREIASSSLRGRHSDATYFQEQGVIGGRSSPWLLESVVYDSDNQPTTRQWTADDVALNSAHLEDFFHRDRVRLYYEPTGYIMASQEILHRLADWTEDKSPESAILWLDGPPIAAEDLDNPLTMMAVHFVNLASTSEIPVISHFCELRRGEQLRTGNSSFEVQGVLGLVCSLARQMIELVSPVFETDKDLSEERFRLVEGSSNSWTDTLALFQDLVELMPYKVFCIIDGMHWIDDSSSSAFVQDLLKALRNDKFKVLFTTSGRSPSLREYLEPAETYMVERPETRRTSAGLRTAIFGDR